MRTLNKIKLIVGLFGIICIFPACLGNIDQLKSTETTPQVTPVVGDRAERPIVVIGRYESSIVGGSHIKFIQRSNNLDLLDMSFSILGAQGSAEQGIGANVGELKRFVVDNKNFYTPPPGEGITSYGTLDVTDLKHNKLRICGVSGSDKCIKAGLRIYTTGTPGPGLWNAVEGYGLPILSSGNAIGLDSAGALTLYEYAIGPLHVVRLCHFTQTACPQDLGDPQEPFKIPVAVNFSDAAQGSYASKLVIE
ncbi:MAG: hypothetical protein HY072_02220, partial [Deltaproteobacteria bacterium]|nr:hypothetical protein [Deltaproteobacteria bacterium]